MKKSVRYFAVMSILLLLTFAVALLTKSPYGNAFFTNTKEIVTSYLVFLLADAIRWITRLKENAESPKKGQEIGWTFSFLLFVTYFLWRYWNHYSFWQGWLIVVICMISIIGLVVRLCNKWDADCVRWATWSACCFVVTVSILGCLVLWQPMTLEEAEELVIAEIGDDSLTFRYIYNGSTMMNHYGAEAPLGYYIFNQKREDGSFGSYGTGRAVVYLGTAQEEYRNPNPKNQLTDT